MKKKDDFSLESSLTRIRKINDDMQSSDQNFDQNVALFKEGVDLIESCRKYLDQSELMIKVLLETPKGPVEED